MAESSSQFSPTTLCYFAPSHQTRGEAIASSIHHPDLGLSSPLPPSGFGDTQQHENQPWFDFRPYVEQVCQKIPRTAQYADHWNTDADVGQSRHTLRASCTAIQFFRDSVYPADATRLPERHHYQDGHAQPSSAEWRMG